MYPTTFKNAYFKGHLYQPLLVKQDNTRVITIPAGLNEGETRFVEDLKDYAKGHAANELYLLRNLTKSKGVGFYESHSFYPDFIMWIKKDEKQIIVFIDPKGLTHTRPGRPQAETSRISQGANQKRVRQPKCKIGCVYSFSHSI